MYHCCLSPVFFKDYNPREFVPQSSLTFFPLSSIPFLELCHFINIGQKHTTKILKKRNVIRLIQSLRIDKGI